MTALAADDATLELPTVLEDEEDGFTLLRLLNHADVGLLSVVRHQASPEFQIPIFDGHRPPPFLRLAITHSGRRVQSSQPAAFLAFQLDKARQRRTATPSVSRSNLKAEATTPRNWVTTESVRTPPRGRLRSNYVLLRLVPRRIRQLALKARAPQEGQVDRLGETGAGACARPLLNCPSCVPLALRRARGLMPSDPETAAASCPRGGYRSVMSTPPSH